jgi:hypothetical protein
MIKLLLWTADTFIVVIILVTSASPGGIPPKLIYKHELLIQQIMKDLYYTNWNN